MISAARILVVEDNDDLAFGLQTNLEVQGYCVALASDGADGLRQALNDTPDMIILDLMLPKLNGLDVLRRFRRRDKSTPVLLLTAKGNEVDKVLGLRLGADDYVTKPFALMELMARVEALLRRAGIRSATEATVYAFGDVEVNVDARQVLKDHQPIELTPKEYGLLVALLQRDGAVASRIELMKEVWGHASAVISRTVDTHVAELRRKLEPDPSNPSHILTIRKAGYRLVLKP
ncbi:MAG: response regulator transcription factor [Pseudomonadota bacterium]